ncbi:MAG TPA: 3-dehydroquinate synthase [Thermodesulfovibrionales bacterium]|nr:3-dehydroquinate synthase [Thermodesulfovibrionales bacterium]
MKDEGKKIEQVRVDLGERSYDIWIGSDILTKCGRLIGDLHFSRIAIISNPTVYGLYGEPLTNTLRNLGNTVDVVIVPDGEEYKDLLWTYYIHGELLKRRLDRSSALIALGGGVIGDITGFVASTYMRGISFIQIPTTLLAQVDSSVGGKTGVNHPLGKNMIGTFYQPRLVWTDVNTLKTLPRREFLAGIAEVVKYGVIWDEEFIRFLEEKRERILGLDDSAVSSIIKRSCEIKAEVVSKDEREAGPRAILNYGHTIGHAIETATGYTAYLHGEAVAIGMLREARLSCLLGLLDSGDGERIGSLIESYGLPTKMPSGIDIDKIISSMELDKKAVRGELKFALPEKMGSVKVREVSDRAMIVESLRAKE